MPLDARHRPVIRRLRPLAVLHYAQSRRWVRLITPGRFWLLRHPEQRPRQLQIPMDDADVGFIDAMLDTIERLAELEARSPDAVLEDLLSADADVVRVRVVHQDADAGQLPLTADVALRESARRALLSAACSVVSPAPFHRRLSRSEPDALLAACRAGQTEVGSYVVKIICPLRAVDPALDLESLPFTRRVTTLLMQSTAELVTSIEQGGVDEYLEANTEYPRVSANLCEALLQMHPDRDAGQVELSSRWAADPRVPPPSESEVPSRVLVKSEYLPEIERVARWLRPRSGKGGPEMFVGTVETLNGVVGDDGRRAGEVYFSLLPTSGDPLRVRANLGAEHYQIAMRAHYHGHAYVRLVGVLHRGARVGRIESLEHIELLTHASPTDEPR
ncbi:MAG: hypothetical protein AAGF11_25475 [Myxococcota bacterium]